MNVYPSVSRFRILRIQTVITRTGCIGRSMIAYPKIAAVQMVLYFDYYISISRERKGRMRAAKQARNTQILRMARQAHSWFVALCSILHSRDRLARVPKEYCDERSDEKRSLDPVFGV